MNNINEHFE